MALSDLILNKGEVVVILAENTLGIVSDDIGVNFGIVQSVNDLCDTTSVGTTVWFDITKATPFMIISGTKFYKLQEQYITASEPIVL